jgi:hypothetical protein
MTGEWETSEWVGEAKCPVCPVIRLSPFGCHSEAPRGDDRRMGDKRMVGRGKVPGLSRDSFVSIRLSIGGAAER